MRTLTHLRPHTLLRLLACLALGALLLVPTGARADGESEEAPQLEITTLDGLDGKRIGAPNGGTMDLILKERVPGVGLVSYFNVYTDMVAALKANKIDAFITDEPVANLLVSRNEGVAVVPEPVELDDYGFALKKGSPLTAEFDRVIEGFREDGTLEELRSRWCGSDEDAKVLPPQDWPTPKGELVAAVEGTNEPMCYIKEGKVVGYTVELFLLCCRELGYAGSIREMGFDGLIAAMESGKADVVCTSLSITDERRQTMDLTVPVYKGAITVVVRASGGSGVGLIEGLTRGFERTFVTEGRWKLVASGLAVTLLISVTSGALGTLLGYAAMRWRHAGSRLAARVVDLWEILLGRLPIVVVLMVFYYVVFGNVDVDGIVVSILVFTLAFGASTEAVMTNEVDAIDPGQREASLALGFDESRTFRGVVFPQAALRFLPILKANFVSLVKDTSIVGLIAVSDLTRASDLIRSRTMEAFFPMMAVAAIYFVCCVILGSLLDVLMRRMDRRQRPRTIDGVQL